MIGVTIGTNGWGEVAKASAERMAFNTGLKCVVVEDWQGDKFEHPVWIKCRLIELFPDESEFLYFDADIWCMKKWNPVELFHRNGMNISAVPEPKVASIEREKKDFKFPLDYTYVNCGLILFSKWHKKYFDYAESKHPNYGSWYDQTPLNEAFLKWGGLQLLEPKYNVLAHQGKLNANIDNVVNLHWCSCNSPEKIRTLQKLHGG